MNHDLHPLFWFILVPLASLLAFGAYLYRTLRGTKEDPWHYDLCQTCGGTGLVPCEVPGFPNAFGDARCPACNGVGDNVPRDLAPEFQHQMNEAEGRASYLREELDLSREDGDRLRSRIVDLEHTLGLLGDAMAAAEQFGTQMMDERDQLRKRNAELQHLFDEANGRFEDLLSELQTLLDIAGVERADGTRGLRVPERIALLVSKASKAEARA